MNGKLGNGRKQPPLPIKPHWQFNLWYVVFALITLFWLRDTWVNSQQVQPIPYSEFVQHLKAGRVASVTVSNNLIEGKLKAPLPDGRTRVVATRVDPALAKEAMRLASHKLPCQTRVVERVHEVV